MLWSVLTFYGPNIHLQILQTDLHTFPWRTSRENFIKDQSIFPWVIVLLILITFSLDYLLILLGEIYRSSLSEDLKLKVIKHSLHNGIKILVFLTMWNTIKTWTATNYMRYTDQIDFKIKILKWDCDCGFHWLAILPTLENFPVRRLRCWWYFIHCFGGTVPVVE